MQIQPNPQEQTVRDQVVARILSDIRNDVQILLPRYQPNPNRPSDEFALLSVGQEPNPYGGSLGPYRYQFEGEDDLLHLLILRQDKNAINAEEAQAVVSFLFPYVPTSLYWFKPGNLSHHFYIGHDILLEYLD